MVLPARMAQGCLRSGKALVSGRRRGSRQGHVWGVFLAALLVPFPNSSPADMCPGAGDPCEGAHHLHRGLEHPWAAEAVERPEHRAALAQPRLPAGRGFPSQRVAKCVFQRITSFWSLFFSPPCRQQLLGCHPHHHDQAAKNYEGLPQA